MTSCAFSQKIYLDIGSTRIKDSSGGFTTFNKSVLLYQNLRVKGYIDFDSLSHGKIYYTGYDLNLLNSKEEGDIILWTGEKPTTSVQFIKETYSFPGYNLNAKIDSLGMDIMGDNPQYKINGTPIVTGTVNLFGYLHKDTAFVGNQKVKFPRVTVYGSGSDSMYMYYNSGTPTIDATEKIVLAAGLQYKFINSPAVELSPTGGEYTIDWATGTNFYDTLSGNSTVVFSNDADGQIITVYYSNNGTSYTVDFPVAVLWTGSTAPVQTASGNDVYTFIKFKNEICGSVVQNVK